MRVVDELAHGKRASRMSAHLIEPCDLLGSEHVLKEQQVELVHLLREADCLGRRQTLMDIMAQLNVVTKLAT